MLGPVRNSSDVRLGSIATPLAALGCVSYLAISMIIATLASCDQVIFRAHFVCTFLVYLRPLCLIKLHA